MSARTLTTHDLPVPVPSPPVPASDGGRIGLRGNLRHIGALVRRNTLQIKQDPESMMDAVLMPIVFALLFVYVFGGALAGDQRTYVNYVVPGLMAMMGMGIAMAVGSGINDDCRKGVMDRFRAMPIARSSVLIAKVVVELGRMLVAIAVLLAVGLLLGLEVRGGPLGLLAAVALAGAFGTSLVWIFILLGLFLRTTQAVQGVSFLLLMPLQFGSSVFADPSTMPTWLETFTTINPLSNLADASRHLINGAGAVAHPALMTLVWATGITLVTAPLAVRRFRTMT